MLSCNKEITNKYTIYYFGDSHFTRLDVDWWLPEYTNYNHAVSGSQIADVFQQLPNSTQKSAISLLEVGVNNTPSLSNAAFIDTAVSSLMVQYDSLFTQMEADFTQSIVLSVIPFSRDYKPGKGDLFSNYFTHLNQQLEMLTQRFPSIYFLNISSNITEPNFYLLKEGITADGLHLNEYGYNLLTAEIKNYLSELTWE